MAGLSKAKIDAAKPRSAPFILWDKGRIPGFGLKVLPTGRKVFILDTRISGRTRRLTLGRFGALTLDSARKIAGDRLHDIALGKDPVAEARATQIAPTVSELCDIYLAAAERGLVTTRFGTPKKASTVAIDRGLIKRHIKPLIGRLLVNNVRQADVQRMIDDIASGKTAIDERTGPRGRARVTGGPGIATRTAELLGGIWSWAAKRGHVEIQSPVVGTDRFKSKPADRRLDGAELSSLGIVIKEVEVKWAKFDQDWMIARQEGRRLPHPPRGLVSPPALAVMKLLATTGMRPGEVAGLMWEEIDLDNQVIILGDTKTGRSKRPIGKPAVGILSEINPTSNKWVFPASSGDGSATFKKPLSVLFATAGIRATPKVLRSTFASVGADLGYSDGTIADILGHARRGVTERHYIRRIDAVLIAAADEISKKIQDLMLSGIDL